MKIKLLTTLLSLTVLTGCSTDSSIASRNLSKAADMFEITRRIVFYNGITDTYMLTIVGRCSIDPAADKISVTCKTSPTSYKKHYLGLSDNVTYIAEQLDGAGVSVYNYRVIFKPESVIPNIDLELSGSRL